MTGAGVIVVAALAGMSSFVAGALGAGGDILYVPLLLYGLPAVTGAGLTVHTATALSLVASLASTAGGGLRYWREDLLDTRAMRIGWKVLALAGGMGGVLSRVVPASALLTVFAAVTSVAAVPLLVPAQGDLRIAATQRDLVAAGLLFGVGLVCGAVGVGGGFLIIAVLLHRMHLKSSSARSTGLALTFFTAAPALVGKTLTGQLAWSPVPLILVASLIGVWLGAQAAPRLPEWAIRGGLVVLVVGLAARVWINVLQEMG
jgi:hypothetical protein